MALAGVGLKQDGYRSIMKQIDDTLEERPSAKNKNLGWMKVYLVLHLEFNSVVCIRDRRSSRTTNCKD